MTKIRTRFITKNITSAIALATTSKLYEIHTILEFCVVLSKLNIIQDIVSCESDLSISTVMIIFCKLCRFQ